MRTIILSALMCVMMATTVSAQQDTIKHAKAFPIHKELRMKEQKGKIEQREQRVKKDHKTPEERAEGKALFFKEKLTLTQVQGEKLQSIFLEEAKAIEKTKADNKKDEIKKIKAVADKKVQKVLTAEQYAKYKEICQRHEKGKGDRRHRGARH